MSTILPHLRRLTAAMTVLLALALCWQCVDIYRTGNAPENLDANGVHLFPVYTAADVGARLRMFVIPGAAYGLLLIVTAAVQSRMPAGKEKISLAPENRLRLMKKRVSTLPEEAAREERFRRNTWVATAVVLIACAALAGTFLLDGSNFVSWDLEPVMADLLIHVAPWVAVGFAAVYTACRTCDGSMLRECESLKSAPQEKPAPSRETAFPMSVVRVSLYGAAMAFILLGVMNGGLRDVLVKAINICTECIGLG